MFVVQLSYIDVILELDVNMHAVISLLLFRNWNRMVEVEETAPFVMKGNLVIFSWRELGWGGGNSILSYFNVVILGWLYTLYYFIFVAWHYYFNICSHSKSNKLRNTLLLSISKLTDELRNNILKSVDA